MNTSDALKIDDTQRYACCWKAIDILSQLLRQQYAIEQLGKPEADPSYGKIGVRIATTKSNIKKELKDRLGDREWDAARFVNRISGKISADINADITEFLEIPNKDWLTAIAEAPIAEPYVYASKREHSAAMAR